MIGTVRTLVGLAGVLAGLWGAWLLLGPDRAGASGLVSTAVWLGAGVVLHDFVLVPVVLLLALVAARVLPGPWRAAAAGGLVVLGSVTLLAIPVLGSFGAEPDDPGLLERPYWAGWLAVAGIVAVGTGAVGLVRRRRPARDPRGVSHD